MENGQGLKTIPFLPKALNTFNQKVQLVVTSITDHLMKIQRVITRVISTI